MPNQIQVSKKLNLIEKELVDLKLLVISLSKMKEKNKILKIEGSFKGIYIHDSDIEKAKKSLFKTDAA